MIQVLLFHIDLALTVAMVTENGRQNRPKYTGVIQKVLPVLSTETLLHIWLSTEYYGFRPSSTAVDTGDTRGLMMSK